MNKKFDNNTDQTFEKINFIENSITERKIMEKRTKTINSITQIIKHFGFYVFIFTACVGVYEANFQIKEQKDIS